MFKTRQNFWRWRQSSACVRSIFWTLLFIFRLLKSAPKTTVSFGTIKFVCYGHQMSIDADANAAPKASHSRAIFRMPSATNAATLAYIPVTRAPLTAVNSAWTAVTRHHSYCTILTDSYFRSEKPACTSLISGGGRKHPMSMSKAPCPMLPRQTPCLFPPLSKAPISEVNDANPPVSGGRVFSVRGGAFCFSIRDSKCECELL